jgi:virginiamycin A acetyltransferase
MAPQLFRALRYDIAIDRRSDEVLRQVIYLRQGLKTLVQGIASLIALPFAALTGFGRIPSIFQAFAQLFSLVPGLPGDFLRVSYYALTLRKCSLHCRVSFGSLFAQSSATVGRGVYIGAHCLLGACEIGERTQIASYVQILSGRYQHERGNDGQILAANEELFIPVVIGADCWIGASAIVMADIGSMSTIGAGAVVTRPMPSSVVAVGNPARQLQRASQ